MSARLLLRNRRRRSARQAGREAAAATCALHQLIDHVHAHTLRGQESCRPFRSLVTSYIRLTSLLRDRNAYLLYLWIRSVQS
eukprot:5083653-Pleurochrysis_carterae.AAC.4